MTDKSGIALMAYHAWACGPVANVQVVQGVTADDTQLVKCLSHYIFATRA
jgi:hypothetical protein